MRRKSSKIFLYLCSSSWFVINEVSLYIDITIGSLLVGTSFHDIFGLIWPSQAVKILDGQIILLIKVLLLLVYFTCVHMTIHSLIKTNFNMFLGFLTYIYLILQFLELLKHDIERNLTRSLAKLQQFLPLHLVFSLQLHLERPLQFLNIHQCMTKVFVDFTHFSLSCVRLRCYRRWFIW